jgi:hypothetical protein
MNQGKRRHEVGKQEMQRAKRELLRLQTFSPTKSNHTRSGGAERTGAR